MQVFEYAIIRLVPKVEREEFMNVGVMVFSKSARFIKAKVSLNENKIKAFAPDADIEQINEHLQSFERICVGGKTGGPIASEDLPERFRWLTAVRSSIIQTSRPHPGKTNDLEKEVERLFEEYVG